MQDLQMFSLYFSSYFLQWFYVLFLQFFEHQKV